VSPRFAELVTRGPLPGIPRTPDEQEDMSTVTDRTSTPTDPATTVHLTDKAIEQVRAIQERENLSEHVLRISVVGGGCSGLSYRMGFVDEPGAADRILEKAGVRVAIDAKSFLYLRGTTVDFQDGLGGKGFTFSNPNAKRTCGCGSSFSG
jgi:iron-sulfur cluster assembly protein